MKYELDPICNREIEPWMLERDRLRLALLAEALANTPYAAVVPAIVERIEALGGLS